MRSSLRWKLVLLTLVVLLVGWQARWLKFGLDLVGGVHFVMQVVPDPSRPVSIDDVREAVLRRVNALGIAETTVAVHGSKRDRLLVELPGFTDVERAKAVIQATGVLELRLEDGTVVIRGADIRTAHAGVDGYGQPDVTFTLHADGARRFAEATAANIGKPLAITLDGKVISAPTIEGRIAGDGHIVGRFTATEAADLAAILRAGELPAKLTYVEQFVMSATLGADSIRAGVAASLLGLALVATFMVLYYRWSGVNAIVALACNLILLLGLLTQMGAAMSLPGIAGFLLTIGMGVDSNVLIFERIKEELAAQAHAHRAVRAGFDRVFLTLLDTHVSALISACFLYQFGTGAVRGFAVTLAAGLIVNLFTSTFVSRALFEAALSLRPRAALSI